MCVVNFKRDRLPTQFKSGFLRLEFITDTKVQVQILNKTHKIIANGTLKLVYNVHMMFQIILNLPGHFV